ETGAHRVVGRAFKLDRFTVAGVVTALSEWLVLDHEARLEEYERLVQRIQRRVPDLPGVTVRPMSFTMEETLVPEPINCLVIQIDPVGGRSAAEVDAWLQAGDP